MVVWHQGVVFNLVLQRTVQCGEFVNLLKSIQNPRFLMSEFIETKVFWSILTGSCGIWVDSHKCLSKNH